LTTDHQTVDAFLSDFMEELANRVASKLIEVAPHPDRLYTPEEVADRLKVSTRHLRNLMAKTGGQPPKLASVGVGGSRRILQSDLDSYIASNRLASGGER
jgi:excisionase family DNA binding protein